MRWRRLSGYKATMVNRAPTASGGRVGAFPTTTAATLVLLAALSTLCGSTCALEESKPRYCDIAVLTVSRPVADSSARADDTASSDFHGLFSLQSSVRRAVTAGRLVHVVSSDGLHTGCTEDMANAPQSPTSRPAADGSGGWVALVQRGRCRIADKVRHAVMTHGAAGVIIYNVGNNSFSFISHDDIVATVVLVGREDGQALVAMLDNTSAAESTATVSIRQGDPDSRTELDPITIVVTAFATLIAATLNSAALLALCRRREKLKPHQYLVVNLLATDLLIGCCAAAQVAVSYGHKHDVCLPDDVAARARCASSLLSRPWNVLLYSNLFTLLLLTAEHFVACRWPFWHKVIVTRRKMALAVAVCWAASCAPDAVVLAAECDAALASGRPLCAYLNEDRIGAEEWSVSAALVAIVTAVLVALLVVYGYILYVIHSPSIGRIEAKKKRNAVVTTLLLLLSFIASYALFYVIHFSVAVDRLAQSRFVASLQESLSSGRSSFPTSALLVDYVLTGVVSAVLDPLIYCARTKEVKLFLLRLFKKKLQRRRATSSYVGSTVSSTMGTLSGVGGGGAGCVSSDGYTLTSALADADDQQL